MNHCYSEDFFKDFYNCFLILKYKEITRKNCSQEFIAFMDAIKNSLMLWLKQNYKIRWKLSF